MRWPLLCTECQRRSTFNVAAGRHGLCLPHKWRAEAQGINLAASYRAWFTRTRGRQTRQLPAVLDPEFTLRSCPQCAAPIEPWQKWDTRRGYRYRRWCTPSEYARRQTCGDPYCAADVNPTITSGWFMGARRMRRLV